MPELPAALSGVGTTALGVAMIRAEETCRPDPLYTDPFAARFAEIGRAAFHPASDPSAFTEEWQTVQRLVAVFAAARTVLVRAIDDVILEAVNRGCDQVVLLGSGLDTRAFRLAWPRAVTVFEIDTPAVVEFREPVLTAATPMTARVVLPVDLREDWTGALNNAGFDPERPSAWVAEGLLGYLPRDDAWRLIHTASRLATAGSRFTCEYNRPRAAGLGASARAIPGARRYLPADRPRGLGDDAEDSLAELGWQVSFHPGAELAADLHRPIPHGRALDLLSATRTSSPTPSGRHLTAERHPT